MKRNCLVSKAFNVMCEIIPSEYAALLQCDALVLAVMSNHTSYGFDLLVGVVLEVLKPTKRPTKIAYVHLWNYAIQVVIELTVSPFG
jgi:hypothetical protein